MDLLERTPDAYDAAATLFAEMVCATGNPAVVDVGRGNGITTSMLRDLGVDPTGINLSRNMIAQVRSRAPDLRFCVGSITELDLVDGSVSEVCAWHSTIDVPDSPLAQAFSKFHVLVESGVTLLASQVGDRPRRLTEAFGVLVNLGWP